MMFECEPTFLDIPSEAIDFFYTEATYKFSNGNEDFFVTISPSYLIVKLKLEELIVV